DKVEFTDVVPGSYLLSSWAEGMVPRRQIIEYKEVIEVPKTKRVTVRFDGRDPYLSIRLRSEQERHWGTGLEKDGRRLWVEVLNSKGEREMIGGAPVAVVPEDSSSRSWRVKPGRYTVRLFGRGFETRTFEDVDVSRDKGA